MESNTATIPLTTGGKAKAHDFFAAIKIFKRAEREQRPPPDERRVLVRFGGFSDVVLSILPDPVEGTYRDTTCHSLGEELKPLLTPEEYDSATRNTYKRLYTSPTVIDSIHQCPSGSPFRCHGAQARLRHR